MKNKVVDELLNTSRMRRHELRALLDKHERSQAWLSRKLNLTSMTISHFCSGKIPINEKRAELIRKYLP